MHLAYVCVYIYIDMCMCVFEKKCQFFVFLLLKNHQVGILGNQLIPNGEIFIHSSKILSDHFTATTDI